MSGGRTVLLLITTFDMGGAERVYVQLARGLAARGYRVIAACLQRRSGLIARDLAQDGVEMVDLGVASRFDVRALARLFRLLRRERVDVVYTFLIHPHLVGRLAARLARVPVLLSSQQTMMYENRALEWANRLTARWCAAVVAVSKNVEDYLFRNVGLPRSKLVTIYNAIEPGPFERIAPRSSGWTEDGPVVGCCARLTPEKDHATLIRAVKIARREFPAIRLRLAGDGPERARLASLVAEEGMDGAVEFLGHLTDVGAFYSSLDIYVQSSYVEGLPCAVLEALACALPVIASRAGGNEEIVVDGAGLLVPCRDDRALAEAIGWMAAHPERARAMGLAGRSIVRARFSSAAMVDATDALIRSFVPAGAGAGA